MHLFCIASANEHYYRKISKQKKMTQDELIKQALHERTSAKAFFSHFRVGALLLSKKGKIYRGSNIELSSYGLTMCAERVAIFKAISEGEQNFQSIFIASDAQKITTPCGACRQVLWELAGDIDVYMINCQGAYQMLKLSQLLPNGFDKTYFNKNEK